MQSCKTFHSQVMFGIRMFAPTAHVTLMSSIQRQVATRHHVWLKRATRHVHPVPITCLLLVNAAALAFKGHVQSWMTADQSFA